MSAAQTFRNPECSLRCDSAKVETSAEPGEHNPRSSPCMYFGLSVNSSEAEPSKVKYGRLLFALLNLYHHQL